MATYLEIEVVNARRRSMRSFDVEIDYIAPGKDWEIGWMPLVLVHLEWQKRPEEVGALVEAAGGRSAAECTRDWDYVRDLEDTDKFMGMCHAIWTLHRARLNR